MADIILIIMFFSLVALCIRDFMSIDKEIKKNFKIAMRHNAQLNLISTFARFDLEVSELDIIKFKIRHEKNELMKGFMERKINNVDKY